MDIHATVSDAYNFVIGWNNEATGLSFSGIGGIAYDASSDISYDIALSDGALELYNTSNIDFGDYGDEVKYELTDYESFAYPKWFEWKRGSFSSFLITGNIGGVRTIPSPIDGGAGLSVSSIPLPATVWLFFSGLLGFFGVARRKKAA
ncbi:VPLPA-CTERM sorting domain-containing protein [Thiohalobacter thiocyanaticus]|nr:VPLPA-CTERM sorting domain-containing protein [Thiohalobacter thiocyanaticus]